MSPKENRSKAVHKSEPYYTNEDVAILHSIVSHAEELLSVLPERERIPTNALFHAYYAILPKIGIDADHDNRYARVLFKIGGRRGDGSLYEKFENVLAQMGIDIQFDYIDEADANRSGLPVGDSSTLLSSTHAHATAGQSFASERHRRSSETAAWPVGFGRIEQTQPRARSSSPYSTLQTPARRAQFHNGDLPIRERQDSRSKQQSPERRGKEIESWMSSRSHGADKYSNHEPQRFDYLNPIAHESYYRDEGQTGMDSRAVHLDADQQYRQSILDQSLYYEKEASPELNYRTGETDEFNISRVRSRHDRSLLRRLMSQWHQQSSWLQHNSAELWAEAEIKDRLMLLRPSFDTWRSRFLQRQQEREEERIQLEQEEEAIHAQETYLLHKYFTRWVSVTSAEKATMDDARRRILIFRLFNAWRDHTVQNQLKARQHVFKKFLAKWQAKRADNVEIERLSVKAYEINLAKRVFWGWFWGFCEKRAPAFWQDNSKRSKIKTWSFKSRILQINLVIAEGSRKIKTEEAFYYAWAERCRVRRELEITAMEQYERKRREQALSLWHRQHQLMAVKKKAERKIGHILTQKLLSRWRLCSQQEQHATKFSNVRILKGALLLWRHQCRAKQLEQHLQRQAFHAWRLAAQVKKANRIFCEKLLRKFMPRLVKTTRRAVTTTEFLTTHAEDVHSHYLKTSVLRKWRERLAAVDSLPERAWNMRPAPVIKECLTKWVSVKRKTEEMRKWAADAEFYLIGNRALAKLRKATEASKKERRKIAYAQARRQNKLNLAKLILDKWRLKAGEVDEINATATDMLENKTMAIATYALEVWRAKSKDVMELNDFAGMSRQRKALGLWTARLSQADRDLAIAEESDVIRLRARCLKKWSREALQYRAHEHLVSELRDKRAKRSLRLAFKHWRQTLEIRQNAGLLFDTHEPNSPRPAAAALNRQVETLINFDESVFRSPVKPHIKDMSPMKATPLPAYLNTPSRRSTLAKSMANIVSTTPAGLSTPFERQLRAQLSGNTLSAYTRRTAARPLSKLRAFDDLVEEVSRDDDEV